MKANKALVLRLLRTARGQLDGIIKMVEENRYCIDISNQIIASESVLKRANREIIRAHMENCMKTAVKEGDESKVEEMSLLLEKILK